MVDALRLVPVQSGDPSGVVASAAYVGGRRVADVPIEDVGEWSRKPGHVAWIGLHESTMMPRVSVVSCQRPVGSAARIGVPGKSARPLPAFTEALSQAAG